MAMKKNLYPLTLKTVGTILDYSKKSRRESPALVVDA